jgi:hypothetical protein
MFDTGTETVITAFLSAMNNNSSFGVIVLIIADLSLIQRIIYKDPSDCNRINYE